MIEDSICTRKAKDWFNMLSPLGKIDFLTWVHKEHPQKMEFAKMSEPERRFHSPTISRPTHQEE